MKIVLFTVIIMISNLVFGDQFHGSAKIEHTKYKSLEVNGSLEFKNLVVETDIHVVGSASGKKLSCMDLRVEGSLDAEYVTANNVRVSGSIDAENVLIYNDLIVDGSLEGDRIVAKGKTTVNGGLEVAHSSFQDMQISGNKFTLLNTEAKNILIQKSVSWLNSWAKNSKEQLFLNGKTTINGNIKFESGDGELIIGDDVIITGGLEGGKIVKQ